MPRIFGQYYTLFGDAYHPDYPQSGQAILLFGLDLLRRITPQNAADGLEALAVLL